MKTLRKHRPKLTKREKELERKREINNLQTILDNHPLTDGEIFELLDKIKELGKELKSIQVAT